MSLHPSKQVQFTNVKPKKTSQLSFISAAFVPQSAHGSLPSSAIFSPLGPGLLSNLFKNIYRIVRRRQRAICANLAKTQGQPKPNHQCYQHHPQNNQQSSPMTWTTQQRHSLLSFHKANVQGDQPQSIQQCHCLPPLHKANVHGDHPLQPSSRQSFHQMIKITYAHQSTPHYYELAHTRYS